MKTGTAKSERRWLLENASAELRRARRNGDVGL